MWLSNVRIPLADGFTREHNLTASECSSVYQAVTLGCIRLISAKTELRVQPLLIPTGKFLILGSSADENGVCIVGPTLLARGKLKSTSTVQ